MIGNPEDAELIHAHVHLCSDAATDPPPEGWLFLAEGAFRYVFLSPDRVVYKVDRPLYRDSWGNRLEAENMERLAGQSDLLFSFPLYTLYSLDNGSEVMAMEFIESSGRRVSLRQRDMIRQAEGVFTDMHPENYILRASHDDIVVVDAGCMLVVEYDSL